MQPCAVCGGVTISATGHCTQCGTFRGNPPQGAVGGYPSPYQPTPHGYGQPVSGGGHAQPTSGGGYPVSAQPGGYPASGGSAHPPQPGYPRTYPPPADPNSRAKPFVVPLVALSVTLVVLVVAIVIVVIVRSDEPGTSVAGPTSPPPGPTATGNPGVDPCVVGSWRVTSHREDVAIEDIGKVTFTGGAGTLVELNADGAGRSTYSGATFKGTAGGQQVKLVLDGTVEFDFMARDGTVSFKSMQAAGTAKGFINGEEVVSEPLSGSDDPAKYTCSGDTMTQSTDSYNTEYERS